VLEFVVLAADEASRLVFSAVTDDDHKPYRVRVTVHDRLTVDRLVGVDQNFAPFWQSVAASWNEDAAECTWQGWDVATDYGPPVMRLLTQSDGRGHVTLTAELAHPYLGDDLPSNEAFGAPTASGAWRVKCVLGLETWQLDDLASAAHALPQSIGGW
jgi:hypothetical protein